MSALWTIDNGDLRLKFHPGQARAWRSEKRFVVVLAGTQSGKTSWGPWWLWNEIYGPNGRGAGDYLAVSATYDLFNLKLLPILLECFENVLGLGRYWAGPRVLELADPVSGKFLAKRATDHMWGRIILRSAESGGGLESATAKGAWLDEAGMYDLETWEAVQRRLTLAQGRCLFTTTIYDLGWLKTKLYDPWEKSRRKHADIDIIQFDSTENPAFPRAEFERARREMQAWKFDMFYRGRYSRPAGLIYSNFNEQLCIVPRFTIPADWQRYMGIDFGGVNTAALFYAEEPTTKRLYLYREYKAGERSAAEHCYYLRQGEPMVPFCVGGSKSEGQWRREFRMGGSYNGQPVGGLPINEPLISDVEVGIGRVFAAHSRNEIVVFDDCSGYLDQKRSYSRKVDASGDPTEEIADKATFHFMDAERYILSRIRAG